LAHRFLSSGICHDTVLYLFPQQGFQPVAAVGILLQKMEKRQLYTKGETIHKTIQKRGIHEIENKRTKRGNKHKKTRMTGQKLHVECLTLQVLPSPFKSSIFSFSIRIYSASLSTCPRFYY
jgi:hypothetical protein